MGVSAMLSVGDTEKKIRKGLAFLMDISNAVIITGGLGPTADDVTTQAIANIFDLPLHVHEDILQEIRSRFERFHIEWTPNNEKQAMFPEGAETIYNPVGTAWGFSLMLNGRVIAVIPGVPSEVARMFPEGVVPILMRESKAPLQTALTRTLKLFGIPEAKIDYTVSLLNIKRPGLSIGFYPRFPENHIVIRVQGFQIPKRSRRDLAEVEKKISDAFHEHLFGYDEETLAGIVARLLIGRKLTLAVAESLTGGLITDRLTDIPGSSAFLDRGIVAYSNTCKMDLLGVPQDILEKYGAVSQETARRMAEGVQKLGKTDLGLATTGIAGPAGGSVEKPVGTVYIAVSDGRETRCRLFSFRWDRRRIKNVSSQWALEMLRRFLLGEEG